MNKIKVFKEEVSDDFWVGLMSGMVLCGVTEIVWKIIWDTDVYLFGSISFIITGFVYYIIIRWVSKNKEKKPINIYGDKQ